MQRDIVYQFHHLYQPIYDIEKNCVFGYEALIQNKNGDRPDQIFRNANANGELYEVDMLSISLAIKAFVNSTMYKREKAVLFINLYPTTIIDRRFNDDIKKLLGDYKDFGAEQLVIEIVETSHFEDYEKLRYAIYYLHYIGIKVAIDDFGKTQNTLHLLFEVDVDFIKLDRYFMLLLQKEHRQQVLLDLVTTFKKSKLLIIEGIETEKDLVVVKNLKVKYGQGFYLAYPLNVEDLK